MNKLQTAAMDMLCVKALLKKNLTMQEVLKMSQEEILGLGVLSGPVRAHIALMARRAKRPETVDEASENIREIKANAGGTDVELSHYEPKEEVRQIQASYVTPTIDAEAVEVEVVAKPEVVYSKDELVAIVAEFKGKTKNSLLKEAKEFLTGKNYVQDELVGVIADAVVKIKSKK